MIELLQEYWKPFLYQDGNHLTGLAMTLWLLSASIFFGFVMSIPLSIARVSTNVLVRWPVQFYTYLFRGTPLYIQLLICYTGIYSLAAVRAQPVLDAFFRDAMNCTILAFALNTCAYTTEIFAGAIRSMAHGEVEAAKAYGLTGWKLYAYVIMPSALRRSLPYYSNEVILMLHSTTDHPGHSESRAGRQLGDLHDLPVVRHRRVDLPGSHFLPGRPVPPG